MKNLLKHNSYILQRLLPMTIFFFAFQMIVRLSFVIWEFGNIEVTFFEALKMFFVGSWFDLVTLSFFIIPYILYLVILPKKFHLGKFDHIFTRICYVILLYLLTYDVASQWVFWDEFHIRYNFIAVDYLVYTNEVLANIWQSYPIIWLLFAIGTFVGAIYYYTRNLLLFKSSEKIGNLKYRLIHGFLYFALSATLFFASNLHQSEVALNEHINEITKNGIFSLFSAFRHNELDYDKFYMSKYEGKTLPSMQSLMEEEEENVRFASNDSNDITRFIPASGQENKKNVIIVMMESLSADYMKEFGNNGNLTPNLDELSKGSLFFSDFYATGTRTVRGMEAITLSIPPTPGRSIVKRPNNENLASLGFVFKDRGYDTKFIYGGNGYFDNMNYFYENNGFDVVDIKNFSKDEQTFGNAWGLCDGDLFNKTILEAGKSYQNNKKFMHMVMTTSNHRPYTFPANDADIPVEGGGRVAGVKYADYAIGEFLKSAKKQPWFDDTIFVFISDHTSGSAGKVELTKEKYHIPLLIYAPSFIKPKEFSHFASQIDFAPTLLGLLNFSYYSRFYGENVLEDVDENPHAFIANYQKVGYEEDEILTILKPGKKFSQYDKDGNLLNNIHEDLLLDTIAYYRHAANWRKNIGRINTITGEVYK